MNSLFSALLRCLNEITKLMNCLAMLIPEIAPLYFMDSSSYGVYLQLKPKPNLGYLPNNSLSWNSVFDSLYPSLDNENNLDAPKCNVKIKCN